MRALGPSLLCSLCLLIPGLALTGEPGISRADDPTARPETPGQGGDAVLPAGYQSIVWGIGTEALQAIRGGMELQITPDPHIKKLIETPAPGQDKGHSVVHWVFWDDKLLEVSIFFSGPFTDREGRELVTKFSGAYGEGQHEAQKQFGRMKRVTDTRKAADAIREKWVWMDPFTVQTLRHDVEEKQWRCVRQSRMYDASRTAQEEDERNIARSKRVQSIELD